MKKIALMASGSGTNAQKIIEYFKNSDSVKVDCLLSDKPSAYALERAKNQGVDTFVFDKNTFYNTAEIPELLEKRKIDLIVLAGFLLLVPESMTKKFRIINIHPALLPKYGGKNMYGMRVHAAVIENGETLSGITIHHVNEKYDEGAIIFQATCPVLKTDTPESLANRIHELEYEYYPKTIDALLRTL